MGRRIKADCVHPRITNLTFHKTQTDPPLIADLYQTVIVLAVTDSKPFRDSINTLKEDLSQKAKLLIHQSIYIPTPTCGDEFWTERMRSMIQFSMVAGISLRVNPRGSETLHLRVAADWDSDWSPHFDRLSRHTKPERSLVMFINQPQH